MIAFAHAIWLPSTSGTRSLSSTRGTLTLPLKRRKPSRWTPSTVPPRFVLKSSYDGALDPLPSDPLPLDQPIKDYIPRAVLSRQGAATTYRAVPKSSLRRNSDRALTLQALSIRGLRSWGDLDEFHKVAQILRRVCSTRPSPYLPRYVDSFEMDTSADRVFVLVTINCGGPSLYDVVLKEGALNSTFIQALFRNMLNALVHLSQQTPPVTHGNIHPQNLLVDVPLAPKAGCTLLDLQPPSAYVVTSPDGTIYYPSEAIGREVAAADDLYAAAAVAFYGLTGVPPSPLEVSSPKEVSSDVNDWPPYSRELQAYRAPDSLHATLVRVLHPRPLHRITTAETALKILTRTWSGKDSAVALNNISSHISICVDNIANTMRVHIRPRSIWSTIPPLAFGVIWTGATVATVVAPGTSLLARAVAAAFAYAGVRVSTSAVRDARAGVTIDVTLKPESSSVAISVLSTRSKESVQVLSEGTLSSTVRATVLVERVSDDASPVHTLMVSDGVASQDLDVPLSHSEMKLICERLNQFLARTRVRGALT